MKSVCEQMKNNFLGNAVEMFFGANEQDCFGNFAPHAIAYQDEFEMGRNGMQLKKSA